MSEPQPGGALRVAVVDDNRDVRGLLRELVTLETSAVVVAEADDGDQAAQVVAESGAELVIMDYQMPRLDGVEATRRVKAACPSTRVVAFSSAADDAVVGSLMEYVRALSVSRR